MSESTDINYTELNDFCSAYPQDARVRTHERLGQHTSFKCGGYADFFCDVLTIRGLQKVVEFSQRTTAPLHILGNGTDVLIKDQGVRGIVIRLTGEPFTTIEQVDEKRFQVGARVALSELLYTTADLGLNGLQALSGIPATVGGALTLNAGAYGERISSLVEEITVMTRNGEVRHVPAKDLVFQYRKGPFEHGEIILQALLVFTQGSRSKILRQALDVAVTRDFKLPHGYSAGCIFKNPTDISAGTLIEKSGLKGLSLEGAYVSEKHGNIIINNRQAHSDHVLKLIDIVRKQVKEKQGVDLSLEIKIWE